MRLYDAKDNRVQVVTNLCHDLALAVNEIDECWPQDEDEFIKDLKNQGWVVDEDGEVYCCEECMKKKKEEENE